MTLIALLLTRLRTTRALPMIFIKNLTTSYLLDLLYIGKTYIDEVIIILVE